MTLIDIAHCGNERTLYLFVRTFHEQGFSNICRLFIEHLSSCQISFFGFQIGKHGKMEWKVIFIRNLAHGIHRLRFTSLRVRVSAFLAIDLCGFVHAPCDGVNESTGSTQSTRLFEILSCSSRVANRCCNLPQHN